MPRIPVNFESAIDTLREEIPPDGSAARAINKTKAPKSMAIRLFPRFAGAAALLTVGAVLWPRPVAATWQQSLDETKKASRIHRVSRSKGIVGFEMWQEGNKESMCVYDPSGHLFSEMRRDGHRSFLYFNPDALHANTLPNQLRVATVSTIRSKWLSHNDSEDLAETMLKRSDLKVIDQKKVSTADGERIRYHVHDSHQKDGLVSVYAEVDTGRIRKIVGDHWESDMDYPASFDPRVFEPRAQTVKGVVTIDTDLEKEQVVRSLAHPQRKGGIALRAVLLDTRGSLCVLWTGSAPDGRLSRPFKVGGVPCGPAYGPAAFTSGFAKDKGSRPAPSIGERLNGMSRAPNVKIGSFVDLDIPTKHGFVSFRHMPVMRIHGIEDLSYQLGMRPKNAWD